MKLTSSFRFILSLVLSCILGCSAPDPDLPYANLASEVRYVGSEQCTGCHKEIYDSYAESEMGRSFHEMSSRNIIEHFPQTSPVYDSTRNFYYEMVRNGERFLQREFRLDRHGRKVHERTMDVDYVMGSGNNLRMYFHDENGMLYELPLTWYVHKQQWDLSPGYRDFENLRFSRFAGEKCISCHNSFMEVSATARERYVKPYPLGIGCERCHGPGELHVRKERGESLEGSYTGKLTIVNPAKLPPQEQLDVCRQCHLQGKAWALRKPDDWFGFKPGRKLETHRSVYFTDTIMKHVIEVGDSPQRLALSACFTKSNGKLTCITCHDPHRSIKSFNARHYETKCLGCHPPDALRGVGAMHIHEVADDCVSCHMNRTGNDNTLHGVSATDHWIRVRADTTPIDWTILRKGAGEREPAVLVPFVDADDGGGKPLRLGMAYLYYFREHDDRVQYLDSALVYLKTGLRRLGGDAIGYFHLGEVQALLQRHEEAVTSFRQSLILSSDSPSVMEQMARSFSSLGRKDSAVYYYQEALQRLPHEPAYMEGLGLALAESGNAERAVQVLENSLRYDTQNQMTYAALGSLYAISLGNPERALDYYRSSLRLDPDVRSLRTNIGNTYLLLGEPKRAIAEYLTQLGLWPDTPEAYVNLGWAYELTGRLTSAHSAYQSALKISPGLDVAQKALERLGNK